MGQIGIYVSFINLVLLMITSYNTGWVQEHLLNINFAQFVAIIAGLLILALVFEFKVDMPNYFSFWNKQFWAHNNPMRQQMEQMQKTIEELQKNINEMRNNT
jgi:hypothetical protein